MKQYKQHNAASVVPHWSVIRDLRVAGDLTGISVADGRIVRRVSLEEFEVRGAAIGQPNQEGHSFYGVFVDDNGNEIIIVKESENIFDLLKQKGLIPQKTYRFDFPRKMGDGQAEANAFMVAGIIADEGGHSSWVAVEGVRREIEGITLEPYNQVPTLLEQIEKTGKKFPHPILIVLSGKPVSFSSVWQDYGKYVLLGAAGILTLVGIPPLYVGAISALMTAAANGDPINLNILSQVASVIVPAEYRTYLKDSNSFIASINSGNYAEAANVLGVKVSPELRSAINSIKSGDYSDVIFNSVRDYVPLVATIQNTIQTDVVNKLYANVTTGTLSNAVIDAGTSVYNNTFSQILSSVTNGTTLSSVVPGMDKVIESIAKYTDDIHTPDVRRAFMGMVLGKPCGTDALDSLLIPALKNQANKIAMEGKKYVMPLCIPFEKRNAIAKLISDDVQVDVIVDDIGNTVTQYAEWY